MPGRKFFHEQAESPVPVADPDHYRFYEEDGAGDVPPHRLSYDGIESGDG